MEESWHLWLRFDMKQSPWYLRRMLDLVSTTFPDFLRRLGAGCDSPLISMSAIGVGELSKAEIEKKNISPEPGYFIIKIKN